VVDYRKFYPCPNKGILDPICGSPEGYVTKDGMWAAIPSNGKKLAIVHNGDIVHIARNYQSAKNYILKEIKKSK
tara:strand:+ start:304 stop:525 length:222 start_codon:yes stop_codon:yes gene_type:complete